MADQTTTIRSGFFDSVNNDRLYSADEMNRPYKRVITEGIFATPQGTPSTDLQVLSAGSAMNIVVKAGEGLLGGKWFENATNITITVPNNTNVLPRRDSVIIQVDKRQSGRKVNIVYREGTPSSNPQPPNIGTVPNVIEKRVANIYVASGATAINQDAIVDLRGSDECPWITSLIKQVDTSTLYAQWQTAYQNFYNQENQRMNNFYNEIEEDVISFMERLTEDVNVTTNIVSLHSTFTSTVETSNVPINIDGFNRLSDNLTVYINGLRAVEGSRYTISQDSASITLTPALVGGQTVEFVVMKSLVGLDSDEAMSMLTELNDDVSNLTIDSGWINFYLESGATAYDADSTPAVRKFGNQVFIRGAIKGLNTLNSAICTLPPAYVPAKPHYYSAVVGGVVCTLKVASTVTIVAKSGDIGSTDMLPIATSFILG